MVEVPEIIQHTIIDHSNINMYLFIYSDFSMQYDLFQES